MADVLLTDDVQAFVGREVHYLAPCPVGEASMRYFALAIGADPTSIAPTLVCETNQFAHRATPDEHGYQGHAWSLPLPVPCRMIRGGNDYRLGRRLRADDVIATTWRVIDMTERSGADGGLMLVVTAEATYRSVTPSDPEGEWLGSNTETLLFLPQPT